MAPKSRRRANNQSTSAAYAADIDSDVPISSYDHQQFQQTATDFHLPSNIYQPRQTVPADLNLTVIARHYPEVTAILDIAPYAVIYTFSPTSQTWEKSGVEGTLFICSLAPPHSQQHDAQVQHRYAAIVLNRRGLDNFHVELLTTDDVEVTDEYIILTDHSATGHDSTDPTIYGVWIFSEPPPNSTAGKREDIGKVIVACAEAAESSRSHAEPAPQSNGGLAALLQSAPQLEPQSQQQAPGRSLMDLLSPGGPPAPQQEAQSYDPFVHPHQPNFPPQQQQQQSWNPQFQLQHQLQHQMNQNPQPHFDAHNFHHQFTQSQQHHPPPHLQHQQQHQQQQQSGWGFQGTSFGQAQQSSPPPPPPQQQAMSQPNAIDGLFQRARMGQAQQRPLM